MERKREPAILTPSEVEILKRGIQDPDIITSYFFRAPGMAEGFLFDSNFRESGKWQKKFHSAKQRDILIIGGFGTGKTVGVGISACVWAMTTHPDFRFLNVAPLGYQANLMREAILTQASGTRFEDLIFSAPERPYPRIELKFWVNDTLVSSSLEFMSVDKNSKNMLGWEGDWINIDEGGLIDNLEDVYIALGSRLRGQIRGRERLGRMSMTTNSWDNPYLWYLFDLAQQDPENYLLLQLSTRDNLNVTEQQLKRMLSKIPEEERQRYLDGARPEGRGNYFAKEKVYACESSKMSEQIEKKVEEGADGYYIEHAKGAGVVYMKTPPEKGEAYIVIGDPGTGSAPNRNAPCVMVWNVSNFPKQRARLVAFWWGDGHGSITPFYSVLLRFAAEYKAIFTGADSTGPQKNTAELLNMYISGNKGSIDYLHRWGMNSNVGGNIDDINFYVAPLDFSGPKKSAYLVATRLFIESNLVEWPKIITGFRSQLLNYDPLKDRAGMPTIPQDIVATLAMSCMAMRVLFNVSPEDYIYENEDSDYDPKNYPEIDWVITRGVPMERPNRNALDIAEDRVHPG